MVRFETLAWAMALKSAVLALCLISGFTQASLAQEELTFAAETAFMVDAETGTVLFARNPDQAVPPASLSKLMTAELVFRALETGSLSGQQQIKVSEDAWRRGGAPSGSSAMFAELNSLVSVDDLLRGMIVQSGNDAAILLATAVAGTEPDFAALMNARAQELGLSNSRFSNATGLPGGDAKVTMRDMVALAQHLHATYPARYRVFSEPEFTWNKIRQLNRNPVLNATSGVDGLMTGFTEASGYGAVVSAERGGRRVFIGASGFKTREARAEGFRSIVEWAFTAFEDKMLFKAATHVGEAQIFGGVEPTVKLIAPRDIILLLPKGRENDVSAQIVYRGPVIAPVADGQAIGKLTINLGDSVVADFPLQAANAVESGGLTERALDAMAELTLGWLR
jgi:serine-type D-Ala-D-Ala carboxypeptidase (penicillin-binding protein 5/6)